MYHTSIVVGKYQTTGKGLACNIVRVLCACCAAGRRVPLLRFAGFVCRAVYTSIRCFCERTKSVSVLAGQNPQENRIYHRVKQNWVTLKVPAHGE